MTIRKLKGYIAFALFIGVIAIGTYTGPSHGWWLVLALVVSVPFGLWIMVAMMEADDDDDGTTLNRQGRADRRPESGPFCTDSLYNARQIFRLEENMPALKNDKFKDYTRYAEHCLNMVASTRDQELRCIQREMAAEWLRLADVVRRPRRSKQMQMG